MTIDEYICQHIDPEPTWLQAVDRDTHLHLYNPRMCSGHLQGRLLKMLVQMCACKHVLELGTYSAYSALCIAEGLPEKGEVHTIEANDELEDFIIRSLSRSPHGHKVKLHVGNALTVIPEISDYGRPWDLVFIDADKRLYSDYYSLVKPFVKHGGMIIADNTLWDGHVIAGERHSAQTLGVMKFNDLVAADPDVEKVILPLRDGLSLIRVI